MAQLPVMDSNCVQLTFKQNADHELVAVKRVKKEPGAVTGKSVVVLRSSDVTTRDDLVFMPNTIEMAQLKKAERGQFKTNVQISSKMTEMDIKKILVESFPFLLKQRFWCAAAVDNRTRLDFHGERRIWDGRAIKQKIKGNSALYIFTEEEPKMSEQSTLKRSHDQITSVENEKSEQLSKREAAGENFPKLTTSPTAYPGWEKQAKLLPAHSLPDYVSSNPKIDPSPGPMETTALKGTLLEKGAQLILPTEGQLLQRNTVDRSVYVMGQHGMSAASHPSTSVSIQEIGSAKDVVTEAVPTSSHSQQKGTTMVPQGGMIVQKIIPTAPDQQSSGKPLVHIVDRRVEARHAGLPVVARTVPHGMVSSTLTPQMRNLNISKAGSIQLQKPVDTEKCAEEGRDMSQHVLPVTTLAQKLHETATAGQQHDAVRSLEQSKQSTVVNTKVRTSDRHCDHVVTSASDRESQSSDFTDSGLDSYGQDDSLQSKESYCNVPMKTQRQEKKGDNLGAAEQPTSGIKEGHCNLLLLGDAASIHPEMERAGTDKQSIVKRICPDRSSVRMETADTDKQSIVKTICPNRSSVRGGSAFTLIFDKHLPTDVKWGHAYFGNLGAVTLEKLNEFNMVGIVPAVASPGRVTVTVRSSNGQFLGETSFHYEDDVEDMLQLLVRDNKLQARLFGLLAQELGNRTSDTEKMQASEQSSFKQTGSAIIENLMLQIVLVIIQSLQMDDGSERTASIINLVEKLFLNMNQLLQMEGGRSVNCPAAQHCVFGNRRVASEEENHWIDKNSDTDYFADNESSSCDSSDLSTSDFDDDSSEIFSKGKEDDIQLKEDAVQKNKDENKVQASIDLLEPQVSEKEVTNSCLKKSDPKEQTSQLRPVTALSGNLMSFVNVGVFPRKQEYIKVIALKNQTKKHGLDENQAFRIGDHYMFIQDVHKMCIVGHCGISFFLSITTQSIPRHLSTMCERWGIQLQSVRDSGEMTTHWLSILFHEIHLNPAEGRLSISLTKPAVAEENNFMQDLQSSYVDDVFSSPNDEDSLVRWEAFEYPTEHCHSTATDIWMLTGIYRPTRKSLFVRVADSKDPLFAESCFEDEDCELVMQCWKWHWCRNNLFKFSKTLKEMQEQSGRFDDKSKSVCSNTVTTDANKTNKIDNRGLNQDTVDASKLGARLFSEAQGNENMTKQATSSGSQVNENDHIRDTYGEGVAVMNTLDNLASGVQESGTVSYPFYSSGGKFPS